MRARSKLRRNVGIPDDRPRDELRKHGDVCRKVDEIALHRNFAAIDVDEVAHDLEGVKADADGQRDLQKRHRNPGQGVQIRDHKIGVFKIREHRKAQYHARRKADLSAAPLTALFDQQAKNVALHDGKKHQQQVFRLAPAVEKQARQQQEAVFQFFRSCKIDKQHAGQKIIQKRDTGKKHRASCRMIWIYASMASS